MPIVSDYTVKQVAKPSGVSVRTLHHYEEIGLLPKARRTPANYRSYGPNDIHSLRFIKRARTLGFPIYDIRDLKKIARRDRLDIAMLAVPAPHAQPVIEQVVAAGIKAILNFSPGSLKVPSDVKLKNVDLTVSLESLSFYLAQGESDDAS